jgi:Flp pilus assembly pilin Flp
MFGVLIRLLKNRDGFTATEYGVMVTTILIALEQLVSRP